MRMSDLEILRRELLERGDEMISFQQLVERFDSVEEVYPDQPWNLVQIYSNFNILIGEKPKIGKWIYVDADNLPNRNCQIMNTYRFKCSKCGRSVTISAAHPEALLLVMYPYCNCGCKMVDIEKDNTHYDEFGFIDPVSFREDYEQNE